MTCFFRCFRFKDSRQPHRQLVAAPVSVKSGEAVISRDKLASLFLSEDSLSNRNDHHSSDPLQPSHGGGDLNDEAGLLKASGSLVDTLDELRRPTKNLEFSSSENANSSSTGLHSSPHETLTNKELNSKDQFNHLATPARMCEPHTASTQDDTPRSCISDSNSLQHFPLEQDSALQLEEASLSSWLKPQPSQKPRIARIPEDRPILGTVASFWNQDQLPNVSPRCWDGNGIPNSTSKYKEDQEVKWHATPFEERLEKALSEESFISQGRNTMTMSCQETEEYDTAHSSTNCAS